MTEEKLKVPVNPGADHPMLLRAFKELFRENAKILGGTAGAIIEERRTGKPVGYKLHKQKGEERKRQMEKIREKEGHELTLRDKENLKNVLEDLDYALNFKSE